MFPTDIISIAQYNAEMRKPLRDKAWFLDHIETDVVIDYGCGDGVLIQHMSEIYPNRIYVGYDINPAELEIARARGVGEWFSDWNALIEYVTEIRQNRRVTVVCNSVIHEVYSYSDVEGVRMFWSHVFQNNFDHIVIRDMLVPAELGMAMQGFVIQVRKLANPKMLEEFEAIHGSIDYQKNFVHFLLKYRYYINWDREVRENYLSYTEGDIFSHIPPGYEIVQDHRFAIPFIRNRIIADFCVDLETPTHVKMIIERIRD